MDPFLQDVDSNTVYYDSSHATEGRQSFNSISVGNTVSISQNARMKTYGVATVPQQTRHARRIYVGGIPPNYVDEDGIRNFMNSVIAQGLSEENDHSYVLSVYINQKKCFAFVELKSIELASACLELDGIIMKNVVLRILRANEYKPELIPPSLNKTIRFDLSGFQFGSTLSAQSHAAENEEPLVEKALDSLIQFTNLSGLEPGCVTIVGFPFDESNRKNATRGIGCVNTPKQFRLLVRKMKFGFLDNPEFDIDISKLKVLDVGDVLAGKTTEESKQNLSTTISELIMRGSVPFVIGGSLDLSYFTTTGLLSCSSSRIAVIYVSSRGDNKILGDGRFYGTKSPPQFQTCQGRYVAFGAQGSEFSKDEANLVRERGGKIIWLTKDLRGGAFPSVLDAFNHVLKEINKKEDPPLPIVVTLDAGVLSASYFPFANSTNSPQGISSSDLVGIAKLAGSDPNVVLLNATEFSAESEESRSNSLLLDVFYHFLLGFATRKDELGRKNPSSGAMSEMFQAKELKPGFIEPLVSPSPSHRKPAFLDLSKVDSSTRLANMHVNADEGSNILTSRTLARHSPDTRLTSEQNVSWSNLPRNDSGVSISYGGMSHPILSAGKSAMTVDVMKLGASGNEFSRSIPRSTSTLSSVSSNPTLDKYGRSSSAYSVRNSTSLSSSGSGVRTVVPLSIGMANTLSHSLPDMMAELHPFDESIDLSADGGLSKRVNYDNSSGKMLNTTHSVDSSTTIPYTTATLSVDLSSQLSPITLGHSQTIGFNFEERANSRQSEPDRL